MNKAYLYYESPEIIKNLIGWGFRRIPRFRWEPTKEEIKYHSSLKKSEYLSAQELQDIQNKKLQKLILYASKHVPYYKDVFRHLGINANDIKNSEDLKRLPILDKDTIRKDPEKFISDKFNDSKNLTKVFTGGSTGTPMKYLFDSHMVGVRRATWWRWSDFAKVDLYNDRMIYCGGAPQKWVYPPEDYRGLVSFDRRRLVLSSAAMSDKVLDRYIQDIQKFKGDYIRGYASGVYMLARKIVDNNLVIPMKAILTSSDTLYPQYREVIEKAFSCQAFDHYGQNEDILTATECEYHNGLHINVENLIAETIDENGQSVIDREGRFVATHLENYVMPLIRYVVGDTGILDPNWTKCDCGRSHQKILKLTGRDDEIIITRSGRRIGAGSLNQPMKYMLTSISKCQYIQESADLIRLKIVPTEFWKGDSDNDLLLKNVKNQVGEEMEILIELVDHIPTRMNGKYQFIISKIDIK